MTDQLTLILNLVRCNDTANFSNKNNAT